MTDHSSTQIKDDRERACVDALQHAGFDWPDLALTEIRRFLAIYDAVCAYEARPFEEDWNQQEEYKPSWPPMSTDWDEARRHRKVLVRTLNSDEFVVLRWASGHWRGCGGLWDADDLAGWWPLPPLKP